MNDRTDPSVGTLRAGDFARMSYQGRAPRTARVLLQFPARPTADPLVWEYRPSVAGTVPPSIRFHFAEPPAGPFLAVEGVAAPFELDIHRRVSNLPGVAVLTGCRVVQ